MFLERSDTTLADDQIRQMSGITLSSEGALNYIYPYLDRMGWVQPDIGAQIGRGTFCRVFPFRDFGNDLLSDRHYVARFNIHPTVSAQSLHLEQWVNNEAIARGFPTPRIVHVDTSRVHSPYPFQLIEWSDGLSLRSAPEENVRHILGQLARELAKLHDKPIGDRYGRVGLGTLPDWSLFWTYNMDSDAEYCLGHDLIIDNQFDQIYAIGDTGARDWEVDGGPRLLHGDLSYDNVLWDFSSNNLKSVIDWEDAVLGDPIFELAGLATFHPVERHSFFLDAYYEGRQRPAEFHLRFWTYYLRIALAKAVHRHRFGYKTEMRPGYQDPNARIGLALEKLKDVS
jgi:aminoglycoside phosphotransferase (APT) family kinase protein